MTREGAVSFVLNLRNQALLGQDSKDSKDSKVASVHPALEKQEHIPTFVREFKRMALINKFWCPRDERVQNKV